VSKLQDILSRLTGVKQGNEGQCMADCPCPHHTKTNNQHLAIKENEEGVVGIHCFAGCTVHEVLAELCLQIKDLFPDQSPVERQQWIEKQAVVNSKNEKDQLAVKLWCELSVIKQSIQGRIFNADKHPANKTECWDKEKEAIRLLPIYFKQYYGKK